MNAPGGLPTERDAGKAYIHERVSIEDRGYSTPCWVWKLTPTEWGYARGAVPGFGYARVHRAAFELWRGDIPAGLHIDHLCRVRLCCNPTHLDAVTQAENNRRTTGIRPRASHCSRGHPRTAENIRHNRGCKVCHREDQRVRNRLRKSAA